MNTHAMFRHACPGRVGIPPFLACAVLVVACHHTRGHAPALALPKVAGLNRTRLALVRGMVADGTLPSALVAPLTALRRNADLALQLQGHGNNETGTGCPERGPWTVTAAPNLPPSGDRHDFSYISTYAWPCNATCPRSSGAHCDQWWRRPVFYCLPCRARPALLLLPPCVPHCLAHTSLHARVAADWC